jgi:hypothetical protein
MVARFLDMRLSAFMYESRTLSVTLPLGWNSSPLLAAFSSA